MANHGPAYGMSRELQIKNEARFNVTEAQETLDWIQQCTGAKLEIDPYRALTQDDVVCCLQDGVQICMLINAITRGTAIQRYISNPRMPFHKMENISAFLDAIKKYGVPEISCFQTVDLYEGKQVYKVFECLRSLAAVAQKRNAPVPFPTWVVKMSETNRRRFEPAVLVQGQTVIPLQYGTNKGASQKGMTPYGLPRQILPDGDRTTTGTGIPQDPTHDENGLPSP